MSLPRLLATAVLGVALAVPLRAHATSGSCTDAPVLLIIQDESGSMADPPDDTIQNDCQDECFPTCPTDCPSKWDIATQVVPQVVNNFNGQFQFAFMSFASDGDCGGGNVVLPVGATPAQIQTQYNNDSPNSATPTGETLANGLTYLQQLSSISTNKYVLVITDGMPNCGSGNDNDPSSYAADVCGQLLAAGFKVFVVGFGNSATDNNDLAALNAMAAAGGTSQAYSATDPSTLESSLNSVLGSVACMCTSTCSTVGATQCMGDQVQTCTAEPTGCNLWITATCPSTQSCSSGQCVVSCADRCTQGATQCSGTELQTCATQSNGCTDWNSSSCGFQQTCQNGTCASSCTNNCLPFTSQCADMNDTESCEMQPSSCFDWTVTPCPSGEICSGGECAASCTDRCTVGATQCAGTGLQTCGAGPSGCTEWQSANDCGTPGCQQGACCPCVLGATQCDASGDYQVCQNADELGGACPNWVTNLCSTSCMEGSCLVACQVNGEINTCPHGHCATVGGGSYCVTNNTDGGVTPIAGTATSSSGSVGSSIGGSIGGSAGAAGSIGGSAAGSSGGHSASGSSGAAGSNGGHGSAGVTGSGASSGTTSRTTGGIATNPSCGCQGGEGGSPFVIGLVWLALRRRSRRA